MRDRAGYEGEWVGSVDRLFLSRGESSTRPLYVPEHRCRVALVLGGGALSDVDAFLFSGDGALVARDRRPLSGGRAVVAVCAGAAARPLHLHLRALVGSGPLEVAIFDVDPQAIGRVAAAMQAVRAPNRGSPAARLAEWFRGMARRGFALRGSIRETVLAAGAPVTGAVRLAQRGCFTLAAFGGVGHADLGLRVFDERGQVVVTADGGARDTAVQACADHPSDWTYELSTGAGDGAVLFVRLDADPIASAGQAGLWLGERRVAPAARTAAQNSTRLEATMIDQGFHRRLGRWLFALAPGEARAQELSLSGGRCVAIGAASHEGVPLAMTITAARGGPPLARPPRPRPSVLRYLCPDSMMRVRVSVASQGGGTAAVVLARAGGGVWVPQQPLGEPELLDAVGEATGDGWRLMGVPARMRIEPGAPLRRPWPSGTGCRRVVWVGERSARAHLRLYQGGHLDAYDVGDVARVTRCSADAAELRVRSVGSGPMEGWLLWFEPRPELTRRR